MAERLLLTDGVRLPLPVSEKVTDADADMEGETVAESVDEGDTVSDGDKDGDGD